MEQETAKMNKENKRLRRMEKYKHKSIRQIARQGGTQEKFTNNIKQEIYMIEHYANGCRQLNLEGERKSKELWDVR